MFFEQEIPESFTFQFCEQIFDGPNLKTQRGLNLMCVPLKRMQRSQIKIPQSCTVMR